MSSDKRRVILVTGSTSGIGLAVAIAFAKHSTPSYIGINGFGSQREIDDALEAVKLAGEGIGRDRAPGHCRVRYFPADLGNPTECESLITRVVDTFGRLDVLVNNAGVQHVSPVDKFSVEAFNRVININLRGVFLTMKHAVPVMKRQKFGRIINIASVHGVQGSPYKSAYVASKHGVVGLTKAVALELAQAEDCNLTCNAVCPGWVLTPLVEKQIDARRQRSGRSFDDEAKALVGEKMPNRRACDAAELGHACTYLSAPLARSTTGATIILDGGWTAGTVVASERAAYARL